MVRVVSGHCWCWFSECNGRDSFGGGRSVATAVIRTIVPVVVVG